MCKQKQWELLAPMCSWGVVHDDRCRQRLRPFVGCRRKHICNITSADIGLGLIKAW